MSARRRRGLTLLEIQISILLLLLVTLYLMSLFASGQKHALRALQYSRATVLAQRRLEEARHSPPQLLRPGRQEEGEPYQGFSTTLQLSPFEGGLQSLEVRVDTPSGAQARAFTLISDPWSFSGVVCDSFSHRVVWVQNTDLMSWDEATRSATNWGPCADGRRGGGLAGQPGFNQLWRGGSDLGPIAFQESLPSPATWGVALAAPVPIPDDLQAPSQMTGLAGDLFGSALAVGDAANRCLWIWRNGSWGPPLRAQDPPLGRVGALASDPGLTLIWVADPDHQCVRKLLCAQAAAAYPPGDLEPAAPQGSWHRRRFRPPAAMGFGSPAGLAMDPLGDRLYVHDRARLYRYHDQSGRWDCLSDLPQDLIQESPSGMACDRFTHQLYLTTLQGSLWKASLSGSLQFRRLWP